MKNRNQTQTRPQARKNSTNLLQMNFFFMNFCF